MCTYIQLISILKKEKKKAPEVKGMIDTSAHAATLEKPVAEKKRGGRELRQAELRPPKRRRNEGSEKSTATTGQASGVQLNTHAL